MPKTMYARDFSEATESTPLIAPSSASSQPTRRYTRPKEFRARPRFSPPLTTHVVHQGNTSSLSASEKKHPLINKKRYVCFCGCNEFLGVTTGHCRCWHLVAVGNASFLLFSGLERYSPHVDCVGLCSSSLIACFTWLSACDYEFLLEGGYCGKLWVDTLPDRFPFNRKLFGGLKVMCDGHRRWR